MTNYSRVFASPFSRLLDDLEEVDRQRADERETERFIKSFVTSDRRSRQAFASVAGQVETMAKAMEADRVQRALAERTEFRARLGDAIAQADAACAAGMLTAEQASRLDLQIGELQRRAAELEARP